jgi:transposase
MRNHGRTNSTKADSFRRIEVITGVARRRRWSLEEKARIVAESLDPA